MLTTLPTPTVGLRIIRAIAYGFPYAFMACVGRLLIFNIQILPNNLQKNCDGIIKKSLEVKWVPKKVKQKIKRKVRKCKLSGTYNRQLSPLSSFRKTVTITGKREKKCVGHKTRV